MTESYEMTSDALAALQAQIQELETEGRADIAAQIKTAREFGDLKENAEYHSAKEAQGLMEARIRNLQHILSKAVVREVPESENCVIPGVVVTVKDSFGTEEYLFASSMEEKADGLITVTPSSPMGKALAGKKVGESATVEAPRGSFSVEILALRPL